MDLLFFYLLYKVQKRLAFLRLLFHIVRQKELFYNFCEENFLLDPTNIQKFVLHSFVKVRLMDLISYLLVYHLVKKAYLVLVIFLK
ncbi:hypothetical protein Mapa_018644 [Marchantia paleacea]|nr:hypothetical protein Mapa_018644 [Marchantia paleacea]